MAGCMGLIWIHSDAFSMLIPNMGMLLYHYEFFENFLTKNEGVDFTLHPHGVSTFKMKKKCQWSNSLVTGSHTFLNNNEGRKICTVITLIVVEDSKAWSSWHGDTLITRNNTSLAKYIADLLLSSLQPLNLAAYAVTMHAVAPL